MGGHFYNFFLKNEGLSHFQKTSNFKVLNNPKTQDRA